MSSVTLDIRQIVLMGAAIAVLAGCAVPMAIPPAPFVGSAAKITATGYGSPASYSQYTVGQQKLMAIRAAQVDAYRSLAERVNGFRVTGSTAVSSFTTQNDMIRSYVDSYIRGARVVSVVAIADGNYEATVELDITQQFNSCVQNSANCGNYSNSSTCWNNACGTGNATSISN